MHMYRETQERTTTQKVQRKVIHHTHINKQSNTKEKIFRYVKLTLPGEVGDIEPSLEATTGVSPSVNGDKIG